MIYCLPWRPKLLVASPMSKQIGSGEGGSMIREEEQGKKERGVKREVAWDFCLSLGLILGLIRL